MLLLVTILITLLHTGAPAQATPRLNHGKTVDEIVRDVMRAADFQRDHLKSYSVMRRYTVRNDHLKRDAVLQVLWTYEPGKGKQFRVVSREGTSGLTARSIMKVIEMEANNSRTNVDPSRISPDHYKFEFVELRQDDYRLRLTPLEKSKYLLNGIACVLRQGGSIVRVEGRTSQRLSFWVSEADVIQEFRNFEGYWLPFKTQSTAQIRFVGKTELTIEAGEYHFSATQ